MSEATRPTATESITYLDPRELLPNPRNPRTDLGDLADLTASIRQGGVLEPLIVAVIRGVRVPVQRGRRPLVSHRPLHIVHGHPAGHSQVA